MKTYLEIGTGAKPNRCDLFSSEIENGRYSYFQDGYHCVFVEANPVYFIRLVTNLKNWNLGTATYTCIHSAISTDSRMETYFEYSSGFGSWSPGSGLASSMKYKKHEYEHPTLEFIVQTTSFKDLLTWCNNKGFDIEIIRMNIGGEEVRILTEFDFSIRPKQFYITFYPDLKNGHKIKEQFENHGYKHMGIINRKESHFLLEK